MSYVRPRAFDAPEERARQGRLLRLVELALLRASAPGVPCLRQGVAGQGGGRFPLSRMRSADRGVSFLWWLAEEADGQVLPLPRLFELPCVRLYPGHCRTPPKTEEICRRYASALMGSTLRQSSLVGLLTQVLPRFRRHDSGGHGTEALSTQTSALLGEWHRKTYS